MSFHTLHKLARYWREFGFSIRESVSIAASGNAGYSGIL